MTINWRDNERKMVEFMNAKMVEIGRAMGAKDVNPVPRLRQLRRDALPIHARPGRHDHGARRPTAASSTLHQQHWDISNLFVIGASTFPNSGAANPTPTILALTYRTADAIVDQYLKKPGMLA